VRLENSFLVPASLEQAWPTLLDIPLMVSCMPGAELVGPVDERTWETNMNVKFGPIALTFGTRVTQDEVDAEAHVVRLKANARELRNRGGAQATVVSSLRPDGEATRVDIGTELLLSGPAAQFGRGLVQDVSTQLVDRFAENIRAVLAERQALSEIGEPGGARSAAAPAAPAATAPAAKPVSGLKIGLRALRMTLARLLRRLSRRAA
jgi:carbon monoxide dehydrogenase subunit G